MARQTRICHKCNISDSFSSISKNVLKITNKLLIISHVCHHFLYKQKVLELYHYNCIIYKHFSKFLCKEKLTFHLKNVLLYRCKKYYM